METAVIGMVAVLFVVTVAITCILCCVSCDSSFTAATFHQDASILQGWAATHSQWQVLGTSGPSFEV